MRLALLAEAEAELDNAATWYDDRSEGLGDEFMDVAREAMALVVDSPETWPLWPGAPARLPPIRRLELADRFGEARLFVGKREWRLRAPSQAQFIEVDLPERGCPASACRIIDLPDGTCICYVDVTGRQAWLIRLRGSELEPLPEPPPIDPVTGARDPRFESTLPSARRRLADRRLRRG